MWICSKCERVFQKASQPHTCKKVSLKDHFLNKQKAKMLFNILLRKINENIGETKTISIPCCIHLFGKYDFLAILPKKDRIEIRFVLNRKLDSRRLKIAVPTSLKHFKNCFDIKEEKEIDEEMLSWIREAYFLKEKSFNNYKI